VVGNQALVDHGELISGTYSGDAAALAAVVEVLELYRNAPVVKTLWDRGMQLRGGLNSAIADAGWNTDALVGGVIAPHQRVAFTDPTLGRRFAGEMAARGVLWHPDLANVCSSHTVDQIARVCAAAGESLAALR
jgi:glutamate-1-semialdehyde aminotransferase